MFECLFLGDSLAVGTAQFTNARLARPCTVVAAEGATAKQILAWRKPARRFGVTVIAIGSNDMPDGLLSERLIRIRSSISSRRVIWILPYSRPRSYCRFQDTTGRSGAAQFLDPALKEYGWIQGRIPPDAWMLRG